MGPRTRIDQIYLGSWDAQENELRPDPLQGLLVVIGLEQSNLKDIVANTRVCVLAVSFLYLEDYHSGRVDLKLFSTCLGLAKRYRKIRGYEEAHAGKKMRRRL